MNKEFSLVAKIVKFRGNYGWYICYQKDKHRVPGEHIGEALNSPSGNQRRVSRNQPGKEKARELGRQRKEK